MDFAGFSIYKIMLSAKQNLLLSFLFECFLFCFLAIVFSLDPSIQCWKTVVKVDFLVLLSMILGKHSLLHNLSIIYYLGFLIDDFWRLSRFSSISSLWIMFVRKRCWMLSDSSSVSVEMIIWFLSFNLLMWHYISWFLTASLR